MASDFDEFPLFDIFTKKGANDDALLMSDIWVSFMSTFYQNLIGYLTQGGIFMPRLTTTQRNALQAPINGQMIYNTTTDSFQGYQGGAWVTFTTS